MSIYKNLLSIQLLNAKIISTEGCIQLILPVILLQELDLLTLECRSQHRHHPKCKQRLKMSSNPFYLGSNLERVTTEIKNTKSSSHDSPGLCLHSKNSTPSNI